VGKNLLDDGVGQRLALGDAVELELAPSARSDRSLIISGSWRKTETPDNADLKRAGAL
jgi:hypothetical protein